MSSRPRGLIILPSKKEKNAKTPKRRDVLAARHRKVSALCCKTCPWNRASASKKGRAAEDLGVNALNSARDHRVPVLDFGRKLEAQHGGFASCQTLVERDSLAQPEPMPFKRQSFKVEGHSDGGEHRRPGVVDACLASSARRGAPHSAHSQGKWRGLPAR